MVKFKKAKFKTTIKVKQRKKPFQIPLIIENSTSLNVKEKVTSSDNSSSSFEQPSTGLTHHQKRNIQLLENWSNIRNQLQAAFIDCSFLPSESVCVICCQDVATIRCESCGPRQYMCSKCAHCLHVERNQFHLLEIRKVIINVNLFI